MPEFLFAQAHSRVERSSGTYNITLCTGIHPLGIRRVCSNRFSSQNRTHPLRFRYSLRSFWTSRIQRETPKTRHARRRTHRPAGFRRNCKSTRSPTRTIQRYRRETSIHHYPIAQCRPLYPLHYFSRPLLYPSSPRPPFLIPCTISVIWRANPRSSLTNPGRFQGVSPKRS